MLRFSRMLVCSIFVSAGAFGVPNPSFAAGDADVFARVRAHGVVHCAGIVRPGIAVPTVDGKHWFGMSVDVCRAVAAAVLGSAERMTFRPDFANGTSTQSDDIVFLSGAELVGQPANGAATLVLGPTIVHDALALLVPAAGVVRASDLTTKTVCVEPGSPADRALIGYFSRHDIALHEHPFQETDEMRQAYGDGECAALAGPLTTLASVRADPQDGRRADRVLPQLLADDPIYAATPNDARWARAVAWTFGVLVAAEDARIDAADALEAVPGVPPAAGAALGLSPTWARDALAAGGNYGALFARNLGSDSKLDLARGANALWRDGGSIFGLYAE